MRAFEIDPNENPMITALRMYGEEQAEHRQKLAKLREMWPEIMAADSQIKPFDQMNPDILGSMARRFIKLEKD